MRRSCENPLVDDTPNDIDALVAQIPELVARMTGHEVGCDCDSCAEVLRRLLDMGQRDIDARRRAGEN